MKIMKQHKLIIVSILFLTLLSACKKEKIVIISFPPQQNNVSNTPLKILYTNSNKAIYILTFMSTTDSSKYFSSIIAANSTNAKLAIPSNMLIGNYDILIDTEGANKINITKYTIGNIKGSITTYPVTIKNVNLLETSPVSLELH